MEYWVVIKETGTRTQECSYEEQHSKRSKARLISMEIIICPPMNLLLGHKMPLSLEADVDPSSELGTDFADLAGRAQREEAEKNNPGGDQPGTNKYMQDAPCAAIVSFKSEVFKKHF